MAGKVTWILLLLGQLCCFEMTPSAFGVALTWDPSPDTNVTGYAIYYGTNSGSPFARVDVGQQTNAVISVPTNGAVFFFLAVAYTADGVESLPSNEVGYTPPGALLTSLSADGLNQQLRFSVGPDQHWQLQFSDDSLTWSTLCELDATTNGWVDVFDPVLPPPSLRAYRLVSVPLGEPRPVLLGAPGDLSLFRVSNPLTMQLRFIVGADRHWELQASADFVQWSRLCELTALADGSLDFFDPVLASRPARYYRLVSTAPPP